MTTITLLPHPDFAPQGITINNAVQGMSLCKNLLNAGIDIDHACEMVCACTTCHVIVLEGLNSLNEATEDEDDMLDKAWGLCNQSRLACQAKLGTSDVVLQIPKYSINHAKEG
jgi:ferredoxin, 2Fe-2S